MSEPMTLEYEKLVSDPSSIFHTPGEVVENDLLSISQKIQILKSWEQDSRLLEVASDEGMGGGESATLRQVQLALKQVCGGC